MPSHGFVSGKSSSSDSRFVLPGPWESITSTGNVKDQTS